jgi:hypothetical protein
MPGKSLQEISWIKPVRSEQGEYSFRVKLTGDKSDFSSMLEAEVAVSSEQLLSYPLFQGVVLKQTGVMVRIKGADEQSATWLDRVEKFLEPPPK